MNLAGITECVAQVNKHRRSIDENGARYMLFFKQYNLGGDRGPSAGAGLSWREIVWAYHSDSQEILVDIVGQASNGKMMWAQARESGIFMWLRDLESVVHSRSSSLTFTYMKLTPAIEKTIRDISTKPLHINIREESN